MDPNNVSLLSVLQGPVLMIVLGALFAIEYAGGPSFSRTWPVLIILAGLFKLIEYKGARSV